MPKTKGENMISGNLLREIEHEFTSLSGLYACDNNEGKDLFELDFSELLNKIEKEKHS